jgi:hypothetical protein
MFIKTTLKDYLKEQIENRKVIHRDDLPMYLWHVTTNYKEVINSGVLKAASGLESGGLGGSESFGVSFVLNEEVAVDIFNELNIINDINNSKTEKEALSIIDKIDDIERRNFILNEYDRTISVYKRYHYALLMALRLSRNSFKFSEKPYYGLIIFNEVNINNKNINIIKIHKDEIPSDLKIIEGADTHLNEIRILGDVPIKKKIIKK